MIYFFAPIAVISGLYIWNMISMRKIFSFYSETYGIGIRKIICLYRQAEYEARKEGVKLTPENYARNTLSQMLNRLAGDDISGLR